MPRVGFSGHDSYAIQYTHSRCPWRTPWQLCPTVCAHSDSDFSFVSVLDIKRTNMINAKGIVGDIDIHLEA